MVKVWEKDDWKNGGKRCKRKESRMEDEKWRTSRRRLALLKWVNLLYLQWEKEGRELFQLIFLFTRLNDQAMINNKSSLEQHKY